jgi:hypothetical protein
MPTRIALSRKTPATAVESVQNDNSLWSLAAQLESYLDGMPIQRVTAAGIAAYLTPLHQTVNLVQDGYIYYDIWDPDLQQWVTVCVQHSVVSVQDAGQPDPLEVTVEMTAQYL